jgi:hypothetical protein
MLVSMKKIILFTIIFIFAIACKKTKFSPEGPTDVRVRNSSDLPLTEVIVNTSGGIDTLGNVSTGALSEYFRFDKAFPKAEISAKINGELFTTGPVNYNGMTYIGQAKITYTVFIKNMSGKTLEISDVSLDAPLD